MKNPLNLFIVIVWLASNAFTQDVGLSGIKTWTDHYEVQDPVGIGFIVSKAFAYDFLSFGLTIHTLVIHENTQDA